MTTLPAILAQASPFEAMDPQTLLLIGLGLVLAALMWHSLRRRKSAGVDGRSDVHARLHARRLEQQAQEDIQELMVRLEELSREICGQIDTRYARLEQTLAQADRTLKALQAAQRQAPPPPGANPQPAPQAPLPADPRHVEIFDAVAAGETPLALARRLRMPVGEVELVLSLERSRRDLAEPADPPPPPHLPPNPRVDERA